MRRAIAVLLPLAVVLAIVLLRLDGPPPKGANAPANEFSSARAMQGLRELLAENVPHPVASPANRRVRERIEQRFRALGYDTVVQRRFACSSGAACAMVENVLARMPGPAKGDVLVLTGHYDSVPAGPGASDDGQGIATMLEIARVVRNERFVNRIAFLATDGEEIGMVGAEAFVADGELSKDIAAVISVEMRGTYGGSNMFETSSGNRWLIRHLANSVARPQASSVFYAVYKLLPNDTDVTVFRRADMAAVSFAALRGVNWYHTAMDDVAHTSPRTLQHHGDNALAMLRTLGNADLQARSSTDATYFDVLALFLVWWPQEWSLRMAVISLVALIVAARRTDPRAMTFGVLAAFTALLIAAVGGQALSQLAQLNSGSINFVARPLPGIAAMWLIGISGALFGAAIFNRRENPRALVYGIAIVWHMIAIALALTFGGAAYLFIVPAIVVSVLAWTHLSETAIATIALTVAAVLFFPFGVMLYDALGGQMMAAVAVLIGALATLAAPLFPRMRYAVGSAVLALVAALIALAQPAFTKERPRSIALSYIDDERATAPRWSTWEVTEPLLQVAKFETKDSTALAPWGRRSMYAAPAPVHPMPRVTMSGERAGNIVTVRVRTHRGANRLTLFVRGGTIRRVNGLAPPPGRGRFRAMRDWQMASAAGVEEMVVEVVANRKIEAAASDFTFGLPPSGAALLRARAASTATTIQDGDTTITRVWGSW
jgi:hypothetical protein